MKTIGIVGGAGYTAGELIRILNHHPKVELKWINSQSQAGKKVSAIHQDLFWATDLVFTDALDLESIDILFLCQGHGKSKSFLNNHKYPDSLKIIDLSRDYRLVEDAEDFVYGLPEWKKSNIQKANKIANPGCFATAIQLALLPLAKAGVLKEDVHVTAITGSTGAGQRPVATTHFSYRNNNISTYKTFTHQHLDEIYQSALGLQADFDSKIRFVPMRGDFSRGIFASVYTAFEGDINAAKQLYKDYYKNDPFTQVVEESLHLKMVVNTNYAALEVNVHDGVIHIQSAIDNLLKGASGQAVQNMNLICGWAEDLGLQLKAKAF